MSDEARKIYHLGIARIGLDFLGDLIHLPEGHKIVAVRPSQESPDFYFEVLIDGPTCPESSTFEPTPQITLLSHVRTQTDITEPKRTITTEITAVEPLDPNTPEPEWLKKARAA